MYRRGRGRVNKSNMQFALQTNEGCDTQSLGQTVPGADGAQLRSASRCAQNQTCYVSCCGLKVAGWQLLAGLRSSAVSLSRDGIANPVSRPRSVRGPTRVCLAADRHSATPSESRTHDAIGLARFGLHSSPTRVTRPQVRDSQDASPSVLAAAPGQSGKTLAISRRYLDTSKADQVASLHTTARTQDAAIWGSESGRSLLRRALFGIGHPNRMPRPFGPRGHARSTFFPGAILPAFPLCACLRTPRRRFRSPKDARSWARAPVSLCMLRRSCLAVTLAADPPPLLAVQRKLFVVVVVVVLRHFVAFPAINASSIKATKKIAVSHKLVVLFFRNCYGFGIGTHMPSLVDISARLSRRRAAVLVASAESNRFA